MVKNATLTMLFLLFIPLAASASAQQAAQEQIVARVVLVIGEAVIAGETTAGESVHAELAYRDAIEVGDRIVTGPDGHLHMRFADGAILSLRPGSELIINSYSYEEQATDHVRMELHRGSLRAITGRIAGEAYVLQVPAGQVHPQDGDFQVTYTSGDRQSLIVFNGSIIAKSPAGELRLGLGADADFGAISINEVPEWFDQPENAVPADRILELK